MIRKIKYADIDFDKYQKCVETALQHNSYADATILDHLCENWELLIFGDYDFVMPIPLKRKYGFQFVLMPLFCQQLGVFSLEINQNIEQKFLKFLLKNYKIVYYAFNFQNDFGENLEIRKNYFIDKKPFALLRKNYFKGRKSTVKVAQYLNFKEVNLDENIYFIKSNFKGLTKKNDLVKFFNYLKFLEERNFLKLFASFKEEQITNLAIVISTENRFSLLGLVNDNDYKIDNGASFLIDRILRENIEHTNFDFMGSTIRGIEVFFKSFGSDLQEYGVIKNSLKDLLKNLLRKS